MSSTMEEFRAKLKSDSSKKGERPALRGSIQDYKGTTQVSLWLNPGFKEAVKEAVKEAIEEKMK